MCWQAWDWETNLLACVRNLLVDPRSHSPDLKRVIICLLAWFGKGYNDFEEERQEVRAEIITLY